MAFDEAAYQSRFLKKHRNADKLPDDLLTRYSIQLPATDAEIAAQLAAVRAVWNRLSGQASTLARPARMCRAEDERLRAEHGAGLATAAFWRGQEQARAAAAQEDGGQMTAALQTSHGPLGVVTTTLVERYAVRFGLDEATAADAVRQAGLDLVPPAAVPDDSGMANYQALVDGLAQGGVATLSQLLHPTVTGYRVVGRWQAPDDPKLRLDAVAIDVRNKVLDRQGKSETVDGQRSALRVLARAVRDGIDLDRVALYQLAQLAHETAALAPQLAVRQLVDVGVHERDAAVLAVTLAERSAESGATGVARVTRLIASGQLREARAAALQLPEGSSRDAADREIEQATTRVRSLLEVARRAAAVPDEEEAARLVAEAAELSREDAAQALVSLPQPPPAALTATVPGNRVVLRWSATAGHGDDTEYVVLRSDGAVPDRGSPVVGRTASITWSDDDPPVSDGLHYAVLAVADGRPDGRPATVRTGFVPPVAGVEVDEGESDVALRWSLHPRCVAVEVRTTPPGAAVTVPAAQRGHQATGLAEGVTHSFALTARYRSASGAELAAPPTVVTATPRATARPLSGLRAQAVLVAGRTRTRIGWRPVDRSEVRLRYASAPSPWSPGTVVGDRDLAGYGAELSGHRTEQSGDVVVLADLPPGLHHIVPFSVGGGGIVVGTPARVGVSEPVRDLQAVRFADFAKLSWTWPEGVQLAEVESSADDDVALFTVSLSDYRGQGGARIQLGRRGTAVAVRSVITFGDRTFTSAPVELTLDGDPEASISYTFGSTGPRLLAGRTRRVTFRSEEGCPRARVVVVGSSAPTVPLEPGDGTELLSTDLSLAPETPVELEFTLPRWLKRPFWLKCFLVSGPARVVHPPVSTLRES